MINHIRKLHSSVKEGFFPISTIFLIHFGIVESCSLLFRIYAALSVSGGSVLEFADCLSTGFVFDLVIAILFFVPTAVFLASAPDSWLRRRKFKSVFTTLIFIDLTFFIFILCCEYVFFGEFGDRFNFIAVDYLVYTHEVLENIWESYPVVLVLVGVVFLSACTCFLLSRASFWPRELSMGRRTKITYVFIAAGLAFAGLSIISEQSLLKDANSYEELVGKNGIFALGTAYNMNEINFDRFYTGIDSRFAAKYVHEKLEGSFEEFENLSEENEDSILRNIRVAEKSKKLNVIIVIMESLSARYMGYYGSPEKLTPNLDGLIEESLFFNHLYATGTRTVRGLEAILLSVPPTPGQSIVRRPAGAGIFNLGEIFIENGYKANFVYGGRAAFDNMEYFFKGNGFSIVDQTSFSKNEIEFSNAWGVSDEDIFRKVVEESDQLYQTNKPFFQVVLTTSNHRPYTFPSGKISRASGSGRLAAVQYADYAIGSFLKRARTKPWYKSTVFVFVSDHNAAVSGGTQILPQDYLIPLIIHSPGNVPSQLVTKLGSQIDLAPTLLGLLRFSYQSRFFGMDLLKEDPNRAFLSTYQKVGYLTPEALTVLSPVKQVEVAKLVDGKVEESTPRRIEFVSSKEEEQIVAAVAHYKVASDWFRERLLDGKLKFDKNINVRGSFAKESSLK